MSNCAGGRRNFQVKTFLRSKNDLCTAPVDAKCTFPVQNLTQHLYIVSFPYATTFIFKRNAMLLRISIAKLISA